MEKKKVSVYTIIIIFLVVIIIMMGFFMYKLYNEKQLAIERESELLSQISGINEKNNEQVTEKNINIIMEKSEIDPDFEKIKSIQINGIDIMNKINNSFDIGNLVSTKKTDEFVIINITRYTTSANLYELYIFDYSGNKLFENSKVQKEYMVYDGEFLFDNDTNTLKFVYKLGYDETGLGGFIFLNGKITDIDELSESDLAYYFLNERIIDADKLSESDKEFLENLNDAVIYEMQYLGNGKFSKPEVSTTIKFNLNYKENASYKRESIFDKQ